MSIITFEDLPSTNTPINAENLNNNFNELNQANIYSTDEIIIGTWFGKPLYRKVLEITGLPNNNQETYSHNITNADKVFVVNAWSLFFQDNNPILSPMPTSWDNNELVGTFSNRNFVAVKTNANFSDRVGIFVLEYTKTTD